MKRRSTLLAMFAAVAANMAAFGFGRSATADREPRRHHVHITGFAFVPASVSVSAGDRIIWTNLDIVPHTASADDLSWDTGELASGESRELVVTASMYSSYFCRHHPAMKASLDVDAP